MLSIQSLDVSIGRKKLLHNISCSLLAGEVCLLKGANGVGKTTLLRLLSGLLPITQGCVMWAGEAIVHSSTYARVLHYIGHRSAIQPYLTVFENARFWPKRTVPINEIAALLNAADLANYADMPARVLSFGQQKRLSLMRLRLSSDKIWILDEPFSGLDTHYRQWLKNMIDTFRQAGGIVILTTHQDIPMCDQWRTIDLSSQVTLS